MSALVLAFCAHEDRQAVARSVLTPDPPMLLWHDAAGVDVAAQHRPLILLAIDAHGGAALARWVEAHGLDGVTGIGLVGVTAPWAERRSAVTQTLEEADAGKGAPFQLPLGPLEPLRAVAERARWRCPARCGFHESGGHPDDRHGMDPAEKVYGRKEDYRLHLVLACACDDGVCSTCGGSGEERIEPPYVLEPEIRDCSTCGGTGKALSSANVALELSGERSPYHGIDDFQATTGGLTVIHYPTRAELDKHGLAAVLKAVGP